MLFVCATQKARRHGRGGGGYQPKEVAESRGGFRVIVVRIIEYEAAGETKTKILHHKTWWPHLTKLCRRCSECRQISHRCLFRGFCCLSPSWPTRDTVRRWQRLQPLRRWWETGCYRPSTARAMWVCPLVSTQRTGWRKADKKAKPTSGRHRGLRSGDSRCYVMASYYLPAN